MYDHYIVEENIFVVTAYILSLQNKFSSVMLNNALKLMVKKRLRCLRKVNMLNSEVLKEK